MAKNYVQEGKVIPFTAAADVVSGQVVVVGTLAGVSLTDVAQGSIGQLAITGVWDIPAATADISEVVRAYGQRVVPVPTGRALPQVTLLRKGVQQRGAGEAKQL